MRLKIHLNVGLICRVKYVSKAVFGHVRFLPLTFGLHNNSFVRFARCGSTLVFFLELLCRITCFFMQGNGRKFVLFLSRSKISIPLLSRSLILLTLN